MKKTISILIFTFLLIQFSVASQKSSYSSIDWSKGNISSIGISKINFSNKGIPTDLESGLPISLNKGRIQAYERAKNSATELLINKILSIQIDGFKTFDDYLTSHNYTQLKLGKLLRERTKIKKIPNSFDSAKCEISLNIGEIITTIPNSYPKDNFPTKLKSKISTTYTSLIIDTRGTNVKPMILPTIYNKNGLEIYNHYFIDIKKAIKKGMVSYVHNENEAKSHKKAGDIPYFTLAISELKGSPVISDKDVRRIFSSERTISKLRNCNVIFIIKKNKEIR